jgi:hypothetical protein
MCVAIAVADAATEDVEAAPDAATPDASDDSTVAAPEGGGATDEDATDGCVIANGVDLCGACASACKWHVCVQDICPPATQTFPRGYDMPAPSGNTAYAQLVGPGDGDAGAAELVGQVVHPGPGVLVGLGVLAEYAGTHVFAGLYTSNYGQPGTLVAGSTEFETNGATPPANGNPLPTIALVPPTVIDDNDYWLVTMWQSDDFVTIEFSQSECTAAAPSQSCLPTYALFGPPFGSLASDAQAESSPSDLHLASPIGFFALTVQPQP